VSAKVKYRTGLLATKGVNSLVGDNQGLFIDGGTHLIMMHLIALVIVIAFSFFGALLLLKITDLISPLKVTPEEMKVGSDYSQHGENLYPSDFSSLKEEIA
jgi:Amt family ammonium transporter